MLKSQNLYLSIGRNDGKVSKTWHKDNRQGRRNRFSLGGARTIRKMTFCEFSKILLSKCSILGGAWAPPAPPVPPPLCMYYILYILFNWTNHSINLSLFTPLNFRACAWQKNSGKVLQNLSYYIYTKTQNYNFIFILCSFIFPLMNDLVWPGNSLKGKNEVAQIENKNWDFGFLCI